MKEKKISPEEELFRTTRERLEKIRETGFRLNSPNGIIDLENEPAYKRRNVQLEQTSPEKYLFLYFNTQEFSTEEIVNSLAFLSEIYALIGGDQLKIAGMRILELKTVLNPVEI